MRIRTITICAVTSVLLSAVGAVVLAPATAVDNGPTETWDERVASLNCEDWQVPGWLDADGLPTSCVNNEAIPGSHKGEPPAEPPVETAEPAPVETVEPEPIPEVEVPAPVVEAPEEENGGCVG
jgi:hypothetical protein